MSVTVHAIYPVSEGSSFDYDYYTKTHVPLVWEHLKPHGMTSFVASRGLAGGPDTPAAYFAIAMMTFPDSQSMQAALDHAQPVLADIPRFTDCEVALLIGEIIA